MALSIGGNPQPFGNLSTGQRVMLAVVADLAIRMVTQNNSKLAARVAPYADNPAFQAFLELKRAAKLGATAVADQTVTKGVSSMRPVVRGISPQAADYDNYRDAFGLLSSAGPRPTASMRTRQPLCVHVRPTGLPMGARYETACRSHV